MGNVNSEQNLKCVTNPTITFQSLLYLSNLSLFNKYVVYFQASVKHVEYLKLE